MQSCRTNDTIRGDTKFECERNTIKERDFYLLRARKLDMDMPPDSLEAGGVNELSVAVAVDESLTTEQAASGCLGTHRERSSNSNTEFISIICSVTCIGSLCCLC